MSARRAFATTQLVIGFIVIIGTILVLVVLLFTGVGKDTTDRFAVTMDQAPANAGGRALKVMEIYAENGVDDTPGYIDYWYLKIKLQPGSGWMNMYQKTIQFAVGNETTEYYTFNESINCSVKNETDIHSIYNTRHSNHFGITYLIRGGGARSFGTLAQGDLALLCFKAPRSIQNDEAFRLNVFPALGVPFGFEDDMPQNLNQERIVVYTRA